MARRTKELTIGEHQYRLTQLGALAGRKLWLELVQALTSPLEKLAAAGNAKVDDAMLISALGALVNGLDEATLERLCEAFGKSCQVRVADDRGGERWPDLVGPVFDDHFAGDYVGLSTWLGECILFNFLESFFPGGSVGAIVANLRSAGAAASK